MNKKIILILCIFMLFAFAQGVSATDNSTSDASVINQADTHEVLGTKYVVDGSSQNQMTDPTIQEAIDKAVDGDTIEITGKNYEHCHFVVNKNLTIISNVGTTMSACPSHTTGSDGVGIFYFGPTSSGSLLSGFTLINNAGKNGNVDPYAIYINGAKNIQITNNTISEVSDGPGIYLKKATQITITNNNIKYSQKGILLENSASIIITNNKIEKNNNAGIYLGTGNKNINILNNDIIGNKWKGVVVESANNVNIISNIIMNNRDNTLQERANNGAGVYVDCAVTSLKINGNYIFENGNYGVFDTYKTKASFANNYQAQEINFNVLVNHKTRALFAQQNEKGETGIIYVGSNLYSMETLCPSTYYEPKVLKDGSRDLVFGEMIKVAKGVYKISLVRADNKEVADCLSVGNITFFLNKEGTSSTIKPRDIYQISQMINGTATANFKNATFKESKNTIIALGPGYGSIDYTNSSTRPCAYLEIPDFDIPSNNAKDTDLNIENSTIYYGNVLKYILKDNDGNAIVNTTISITINGKTYTRTTDKDGIASITIRLISNKEYKINASYAGDDDYNPTELTSTINVLPTVTAEDVEKIFRNNTQYNPKLVDNTGNILKNTKVTMNINGVFYTRTSNNKGIATLNINLNPGKYIITSTNSVTEESISNTIVVKANMDQNKDLIKYFQNASQYSIRTLDNQGNPIANQTVKFNINGVFYTRTTNDKGIATLNINLNPGKYIITAQYNDCFVSNNITVLPVLTTSDLTKFFGISDSLKGKLVNGQGSPLANVNLTFNINGVFYNRTTDENGTARLNINLNPGEYIATINYGNAFTSAKVNVLNTILIKENATNSEIQSIINSISNNGAIKFTGKEYNNISLNISKSIILTSDVNTTLNGKLNTCVLNIVADGVLVKNLNINGNNGSGIIINNAKNTVIENNNLNNLLNQSNMANYNTGKTLLPGNGIAILNSENTTIENNNIQYYYNGIYLNSAKYNSIQKNTITRNNFGIEFDKDDSNTLINDNNIIYNIGFNTMTMIEGPYGYGISIRHSGVNITVTNNRINNNYMGVFIDAKNCSGIKITSNEISNSTIEGLTVNENYTYAPGATLIVENNAIYNNAKGPSQIILGEVSANPNGIYGPGEWNDTLKLQLGPNWYGTNKYTTWGENNTGPGTICPRIHTTLIPYNISCIAPGKYEVTFYNNGSVADKLPDLTTYFVLNYKTEKEEVVKVVVHQGKATFGFSTENYDSTNNIIEGFSVFEEDRPKSVIYTYNVPESEIPK
ncbi:right-handed parallel beta-helix repeat-containing protein [uncultured Methanobrevibacter sp.]|uniref:right-handed parallel beta-helix repeat-containing protein n=1 Tax=uncultured Methanobrevibacter sp. TaxID=253161 RepID=UPI00260215E1|nr:right-handed parallel beta-helix repeat-containing protein [uncultured Methanobrevibacter sp.]